MQEKKDKGLFSKIVSEYKKVIWPKGSEVFQVTIIVLLISAFVAGLIILFDFSFKYIIDTISNLLTRIFK